MACRRRRAAEPVPRDPNLDAELALWGAGKRRVAGLDEAGRGAWAGPVCAAAVVLPDNPQIQIRLAGVRDSKQMTRAQRVLAADAVKEFSLAWGVGWADNREIDAIGILPSTRLAMTRALEACISGMINLGCIDHLLLDALLLPDLSTSQTAIVHGDARSLSIAAASVLAKTSRDALMARLSEAYPGYGFHHNAGYGTALHRSGLGSLGPCAIHRMSYAPLRQLRFVFENSS